MKIIIPQNYFAGLWALNLADEFKNNIQIKPASLIAQEIVDSEEPDNLYMLPTLNLMKNKELFVSSKCAVSFDGLLSNSYLYFKPNSEVFDSIYVRGDVSMNEILLSKILFAERYESSPEIKLDSEPELDKSGKNYLIVGNENINADFMEEGVGFSDQMASLLTYPYVDFVLVSKSQEGLSEFDSKYPSFDKLVIDSIDDSLEKFKFKPEISEFIKMNIDSVSFELSQIEREALNELLRLPYYHGMMEEMFDLKFI
ncbi:MAG: hypothetical protein KKA84_09480 [Bacteroidetes bacterium]|nr:hypothetical protein [Bacteroidota bacterium]